MRNVKCVCVEENLFDKLNSILFADGKVSTVPFKGRTIQTRTLTGVKKYRQISVENEQRE